MREPFPISLGCAASFEPKPSNPEQANHVEQMLTNRKHHRRRWKHSSSIIIPVFVLGFGMLFSFFFFK
jgi:hypothetical protein